METSRKRRTTHRHPAWLALQPLIRGRLDEIRRTLGMKVPEFLQMTGLSESAWDKKSRPLDIVDLILVADATGYRREWLVFGQLPKRVADAAIGDTLDSALFAYLVTELSLGLNRAAFDATREEVTAALAEVVRLSGESGSVLSVTERMFREPVGSIIERTRESNRMALRRHLESKYKDSPRKMLHLLKALEGTPLSTRELPGHHTPEGFLESHTAPPAMIFSDLPLPKYAEFTRLRVSDGFAVTGKVEMTPEAWARLGVEKPDDDAAALAFKTLASMVSPERAKMIQEAYDAGELSKLRASDLATLAEVAAAVQGKAPKAKSPKKRPAAKK